MVYRGLLVWRCRREMVLQEDRWLAAISAEGLPRSTAIATRGSGSRAETAESVSACINHGYPEEPLSRIWWIRPGMMMEGAGRPRSRKSSRPLRPCD